LIVALTQRRTIAPTQARQLSPSKGAEAQQDFETLSDSDALQKALGRFQQCRAPRVDALAKLSTGAGVLLRRPGLLRDSLVVGASWFPSGIAARVDALVTEGAG
jgi:hypothetical protein